MTSKTGPLLIRRTLAKQAYEQLRLRILDGSLPPGSRVVVRPLCSQLGLSPTPIRAALSALEREGFLTATAHRGYTVPQMSPDAMRDIYELREALDVIAAQRAAVGSGRDELLPKLRRLLGQQQRKVAAGRLSGYSDLDLAFHRAIWDASGNSHLLNVAENLSGQVRLGSASSSQVSGRLPHALNEHLTIIEALAVGDPQAAAEAARAHVRNAGVALEAHLAAEFHPDLRK